MDLTTDFNQHEGTEEPYRIRHHAAKLVWIIGAIQALVFGCCTTSMAIVATIPPEQLEQMTDPATFDQFTRAMPLFLPVAITVFVLGFVPGVVYLIAGFGVKAGKPPATSLALVLMTTQSIVLGVLLLNAVVAAVASHRPADLTLGVLTHGSLLVLLGFGIHRLWRVKQYNQNHLEEQTDPWNDL